MRARVAVGAALVVVLVAFGVLLSRREPRLSGSNSEVVASGVALPVRPGRTRCQSAQYVPKGTHAVRVFVGGRPPGRGEPFAVLIRARGRELSSGRAAGGYSPGALRVGLAAVGANTGRATVCIRNLGRGGLQFAGNRTALSPNGSGVHAPDDVRLDFLRGGRESWWQIAPVVADRFGLEKAGWVGSWTMWAVFAWLGGLFATALLLLLRREDP
jgi:hypothetical protein